MSAVIKDSYHTARIRHNCINCGRTIYPGMKYRRIYGKGFEMDPIVEIKLCDNCTDSKEDGHTVLILNT